MSKVSKVFNFCPVSVHVNGVDYQCNYLAGHDGPHRAVKRYELQNKVVEVEWPIKKGSIGNVARVSVTIQTDHRICKIKTKYSTPR